MPNFLNVFVLGTGRCGTLSFISGCKFITNFTAGHETRTSLLGRERFNYPMGHIEADNRLSWFLGKLEKVFGKEAFYVHLLRNRDEVSRSYAKRLFPGGIMKSYADGVLMPRQYPRQAAKDPLAIAYDLVDTVNSNIEMFLKDKPYQMTVHIESVGKQFPQFFERIGAKGDLRAALKELKTPKNTSQMKSGSGGSV